MFGPPARISCVGEGINFFGGSGGLFFIKGNHWRDIAVTRCDLSRDIGGFLPLSLFSLAIPRSRPMSLQALSVSLDFLDGERDHLGGRTKLAKSPD